MRGNLSIVKIMIFSLTLPMFLMLSNSNSSAAEYGLGVSFDGSGQSIYVPIFQIILELNCQSHT